MTIEEFIDKTNKLFNVDIKTRLRDKELTAVRHSFYVIGYNKIGFSYNGMAKATGRTHATAWSANQKHNDDYKMDKHYKRIYDILHSELFGVKTETKKIHINGFDELLELSEEELSEFKETRLKPFLSMLKSRKKLKQVN